ncbi:MAG: hypothetical protein AABY22_09605, partial [Nanoarchaeota archaeon]
FYFLMIYFYFCFSDYRANGEWFTLPDKEIKWLSSIEEFTEEFWKKWKIIKEEGHLRLGQYYFNELYKENPNLAKKVLQVREEEELGLDSIDRKIKDLGVTDGMRAQYLYRKLKKLETIEERKEAWKELVRKKLITDTVGTQIKFLIKREATQ